MGEVQNPKGNERVPLYVHMNGKKLVIRTLAFRKCDQLSLDLVFDGEFGLSHSYAAGSVFFSSYTSVLEDRDKYPFLKCVIKGFMHYVLI